MSTLKNTKRAHRVVCLCKARECYLGHFIDAYGEPQRGVEVLHSTFNAHALADQSVQARGRNSEPHLTSTPDDLIASLAQLHIPPKMMHPRRDVHQEESSNEGSSEHSCIEKATSLFTYDCDE